MWQPTKEQEQSYEEYGYFIERDVIPHDLAIEMRGVIKNTILMPEPDTVADADPMDPMGDSPEARTARFRKLGKFCVKSPLIWHHAHAGEQVLDIARYFVGDDILVKFNSCFLKPAKSGSATPWHQDNGLWRDGDVYSFNFWMALDPATKANGCLQFIPGSHRTEIVPHVLYEDSIHAELPHERVEEMIATYGVHHVELEPGSIVCWHSSLWHYSPPNVSEQGRIAIAGVMNSPEIIERIGRSHQLEIPWGLRKGERCTQFPPEYYAVPEMFVQKAPPHRKASEVA